MKLHKNGSRVAVPEEIERERQLAARQAMAHSQAIGAFRGTVSTVAAHVASGLLASASGAGGSLASGALMNGAEGDRIRSAVADKSVDIARMIVVRAHGCAFPTVAELGQGAEAEESAPSQEG